VRRREPRAFREVVVRSELTVFRLTAAAGALAVLGAALRRWRAFELRDRVVLVTGGSRGLGLVLARQLVAHGAKVAICARDPDGLERARDELAARGGHVLAVPCDLTDRAQLAALVATVERELGPIDVLVNNAGVIQSGPLALMTEADFQTAMAVHFWAPYHLSRAVAEGMRRRGSGRIANITSVGGKLAAPHLLPYTASKFALVGLSEGMRAELAKDGVLVTTVVPGLMRTGSPLRALFKGKHRAEFAWFSILDSSRLTSMSAERAARRIIAAIRHGTPELVLSVQARLAIALAALAPNLVQRLLGLVNRLLPGPGGIGEATATGLDSASRLAPSLLTRTTERAARRNNEL
jgi:NAD(P)-dependent dehydrogenase (short-subunit alcohol dehydrogenase family)